MLLYSMVLVTGEAVCNQRKVMSSPGCLIQRNAASTRMAMYGRTNIILRGRKGRRAT